MHSLKKLRRKPSIVSLKYMCSKSHIFQAIPPIWDFFAKDCPA